MPGVRTAGYVVALLLTAACSSAPEAAALDGAPAGQASATFSVFSDEHGSLLVSGHTQVPVRAPAPGGVASSTSVVPIDSSHVAILDEAGLSIVASDGQSRSVTCDGCTGIVWSGTDLVTLRGGLGDGQSFTLDRYTTDLVRTSSAVAWPQTERTDPDQDRYAYSVELVAASPTTVWVAYADRFGFARGGSRTIAAYVGGSLVATNHVRGSVYDWSLSPDGRFLAMADGGSGGACITTAELDVLDLTTMHLLDTAPRMPTAALLAADPDDVPDLTFFATDLVWEGSAVVVQGTTSRGNTPADESRAGGDCDPKAMPWARRYDTTSQTFQDVQHTADPGVVVGPGCHDRAVPTDSDSGTSRWQLTSDAGLGDKLPDGMSPAYTPAAPQCLDVTW